MVSDIKVGHTTRKCGFGLHRKNPPKSLLLARIRIPRFSGKNIMSFNTLQQFATKWRSFIYNLDLRGYTGHWTFAGSLCLPLSTSGSLWQEFDCHMVYMVYCRKYNYNWSDYMG